jgi:hypothetical protein
MAEKEMLCGDSAQYIMDMDKLIGNEKMNHLLMGRMWILRLPWS